MWRRATELFVHQRTPSPKINIIQHPRRFEEKNSCVGFNRILTCIFSSCVSDPFLPTIKLVMWVEPIFLRAAQGHILAKPKHFCFQRYWTPNAAKYPCNNTRKNFSRLDFPGWLAARRRVFWIRNAGQKPRDRFADSSRQTPWVA